MQHDFDYLIVGGGMTADAAAKAIHEADAEARIGMVSDESHAPYERPPLSKALWKDKAVEAIDLGTAKSGTTLHLGMRIVALDRVAHTVRDDQGDTYRYRKLLLATGATPRKLPFAGERVINFRTLDDYLALRRFAKPGARIAVVGGGFIGSELAASLASNGSKVTMIFPGEAIGAGRYPAALSDFLNSYYREHGVELRTGAKVDDGKADANGVDLLLSDGSTLRVDAVVAGLGVIPNVELAQQAGLKIDNGIVVDDRLRTSDLDIFAAGDVANFHNAALDTRMRVEHENAAISMGHHAGRVMAGADEAYTTLPFFYSDLFDLGYEAVGMLDDRLDVIEHWTTPFREGVVYYLDDDRVRGVLLWNVWGQVDAARELIAERGHHDAESLRGRLPKAV
ncbi:MAG: NAD(P)/FAD-dependent oxidoreductase [Xanthomonadales bacterium PRO7]|jgi:NADPH-dependent 2,4-dienoyl-CoA reductase/sulfur reductase-like enzyme|nr:NAD(P)/FAD-dependent oxidoreductase [Xanthomonadales bacterium PRO7]